MLLFKKEHVKMILEGEKTQTRRVWKRKRANVGSIHLAKTEMLSKEFFAKLLIKKVWKEKIGDISPEDARKEGYNGVEEFLWIFERINKKSLAKINKWFNLEVFVIEFEVVS